MELFEAIKERRSIRKFCDKPVPDDMLDKIIQAGKAAPSAGNLQARDFFVVRDQALKEKLVKAAMNQRFIGQVPVVIVICTNYQAIESYGDRGRELYTIQDSAASAQNMLLAIHGLGLASCWVGAFDEKAAAAALDLPEHIRPAAILPIGWPDQECRERSKRRDDVHFIK